MRRIHSILYKLRLPMIVVFNKTDVADPEQVKKWLKDYESFTVNYLTLSMWTQSE